MLWERDSYTAPISYLFNIFIYEYDISKANISILFSKGVINKKTYDFLYDAPRMVRQVYIGKLQKDIKISEALKNGFIEYRELFFKSNNIKDSEILSIKKDAIYVISRPIINTEFGIVKFIEKNIYTGFYKINNLELYYKYNNITNDEKLDIKGINDNTLKYHENYFVQFLKDLFYTIQCNGSHIALRLLRDFYIKYINRELDIEYYRQFDTMSEYHLIVHTSNNTGFIMDNPIDKSIIDISYNLRILTKLQKILINMYFDQNV